MKITQDVRDYAAQIGVSETEALEKGMEEKAVHGLRHEKDNRGGFRSRPFYKNRVFTTKQL
jgi:hypothetical protein